MSRRATLLSTVYLTIGGILTAVGFFASQESVRDLIYIVAAVQVFPTLLVARKLNKLPWSLILLFVAVGLFYAGEQVVSGDGPTYNSPLAVLLAMGGASCLVAALVVLVRKSMPSPSRALIGDAAIVALGSWIVSWALLVQPVAEAQNTSPTGTFLYGLYQPTASVVAFLVVMVVLGRRNRPPALWLIVAALGCNMLGDLLYALMDAGHISTSADRWIMPLYTFGYFSASAAFLHPSFQELSRPQPNPRPDSAGRLVLISVALVAPVIVLALSSPNDTPDRIVRALSAVALACVVTARVALAARANQQARAELLHGAQTDPLTGLPNRSLLLETINDLLRSSWSPDSQPMLFFVDLDRFKNINDSLGHAAGDEVLVTVARRLQQCVPAGATVARLSGDEYVVLDPTSKSEADGDALAEAILTIFREPLPLSQGDVFITASIGVAAISPTTSTSPEDLVRHADTAMYGAKDAGRNCYAKYDESMHQKIAKRLTIETALYRALDRRELRLFHQPIVDWRKGRVAGFEALMRWQQSDGRIVSPAEFIPIAEETGTIVPIGAWALLEALTQLRQWIDEEVCEPDTTMSVNVSPRQLADGNFSAVVLEALARSGVPHENLVLEVTENVMITDPAKALATLDPLCRLGVRVALDDFGTGYSSLSLLQKFPLHQLKMDRTFVQGVAHNDNDERLASIMFNIADELHIELVAEGVETPNQFLKLLSLGFVKFQGFFFSKPVEPDGMRRTVEELGKVKSLLPLQYQLLNNNQN